MEIIRRARLRYLLPVLLSLCGVPSASAKAAAVSPVLPDLQTAEEMGQDLFVLSGSVGMVLVVVRDNQVFFHGYGETAPGSHQLPSQDSVLRLCSLTKIFYGGCVQQAGNGQSRPSGRPAAAVFPKACGGADAR